MSNKNKEQAAKTRQAILEAAIPVFQENGFTKARLQDIATAAGVTRGACYWHFKNKAEIFAELVETIFIPIYDHVEDLAASDKPPREKLKVIFVDLMTSMIHDERFRSVVQISLNKVEYTGEMLDWLEGYEEQDLQNIEVIAGIYAEGISSGEFKGKDSRVCAVAFVSYLTGLMQNMSDFKNVIDYEQSLEELADFILPPDSTS